MHPQPDLNEIAVPDEDRDAAVTALQDLFGGSFTLPGDAGTDPAAPLGPGATGDWTTARDSVPDGTEGALLYVHGGGFAAADPVMEALAAYRLSQAAARPAFGLRYRLAPQHPYPAAVDDVLAGYRALLAQGRPPSGIVLSGESAGATLVLSALLRMKTESLPLPAGAIVISPIADLTLSSPSLRVDGGDFIDRATLATLCAQYLKGAPADRAPQSPLYGDLSGLPPLLIAVGTGEVLLDDARRLARAAAGAGTPATLDEYAGMPHAFNSTLLSPRADRLLVARTLQTRIRDWVAALPT